MSKPNANEAFFANNSLSTQNSSAIRAVSDATSGGSGLKRHAIPSPLHSVGILQPRHSKLVVFTRLMDTVALTLSLWLSVWLYEVSWQEQHTLMLGCGLGLFVFVAQFNDLYRSWRGAGFWQEIVPLWLTWLVVIMCLLFLAYTTKTSAEYSRRIVISWFILTPVILTVWRAGLHLTLGLLRQHGLNTRSLAIVGARDLGVRLAHIILKAPWMGLKPVGFYDDRSKAGSRPFSTEPLQIVGNLDTLLEHARAGKIEMVYITLPMRAEKRVQELIAKLADTTASVYMVPDFFMFDLLNSTWTTIGDLPAVSIYETPFYGVDGWVKRIEDLILASLILLAIALPILIIAIAIKCSSPGPVLFKQRRYGLQGQMIEVWKFRTMSVCEDGDEVTQATQYDPRNTPLGAVLRRTSLDELPQFINVLQGRMSIVGPRPHAIVHNEQYRKLINGYMLRHKVKPGITGWAQINGWRGETQTLDKMKSRVEHDLAYIRNWSLWLDLRIIALSLFKGFGGRNSY